MDYHVIKDDDVFLVTEHMGDIVAGSENTFGLYYQDTRFLSRMELFVDGRKPTLLSSSNKHSFLSVFHYTMAVPDVGSFDIQRERFIYQGTFYEKVTVINYFLTEKQFHLTMSFGADFQDMFIVRRYREGFLGQTKTPIQGENQLTLAYEGTDHLRRETVIHWDRHANTTMDGDVNFSLQLLPKEQTAITFMVTPKIDRQQDRKRVLSFEKAREKLHEQYGKWQEQTTKVITNDAQFNALFRKSSEDIRMLMVHKGYGNMPVAGLPWYAVPFGRDSIITSLFMLPINPQTAKNTLKTLAKYQGKENNTWRDEQPGKIMHELRRGELANTKQIPFTPYYGTVDATPLFLILLAEYFHWTADDELVKELLPNVRRAFAWIERNCHEETGFLTYDQQADKGFPNQGWKDSANSNIHHDGRYAQSPIALIEVQGYVFQAKKMLAPILKKIGKRDMAKQLNQEAKVMKEAIDHYFWLENEQYYAIALDKEQKPVRSVTSNVGHLLFSGVLDYKQAQAVVDRMFSEELFSGYGIRTMGSQEVGYNPQSYHNGSVWPHDNGVILLGLNRSGFQAEATQLMNGLHKAANHFDQQRLPELFCGYSSALGYPVPYPTTCSPQAWAGTAVFAMIHTILGLQIDGLDRTIQVVPTCPKGMNMCMVRQLQVGAGHLDLDVNWDGDQPVVTVVKNTTEYEVIVG